MSSSTLSYALAVTALITVFGAGCSSSPDRVHAAVRAAEDRKAASDFALPDANSASVKLSDYRGRVVLLNFWATWCGPCKTEIPWFIEFEKMYKDRGFAVLGVSMDEDGWQVVKPFIDQRAVNYRVMVGNNGVARFYGGVESLPTTFMIDREGRIASGHVGLVSKRDYEREILQLLDDKHADAVNRDVTRQVHFPN